jgi:predicted TIM-barrel fold metal-dependent hydrolase
VLAATGIYSLAARRAETAPRSPRDSNEGATQDQEWPREPAPIIDTHIHLVRGNPDLKPLGPYGERVTDSPEEEKAGWLKREMKAAGIRMAFAMGHRDGPPDDPLGIASTLRLASRVPGLKAIGVADPTRTTPEHLRAVEQQIERERASVVALKAYLGYIPIGPEDERYEPYYRLAAKYRLPFILHTGDTWSSKALVKYAHPLRVDEVAATHPSLRFVMAHCGNPWFTDAAEVMFKNDNVWADTSGLFSGDEKSVDELLDRPSLPEVLHGFNIREFKNAITFVDRYDRIVFGSDWPIGPMAAYRRFFEALIPSEHHEKVFRKNAEELFLTGSPPAKN